MKVRAEIVVRGYHLDMFRHVNNARYLEFLEEGCWAFFDENPHSFYRLKGVNFLVVNIKINYRRPATLGDVLEVQPHLTKINNTSGVLRQYIYNKNSSELIADADVKFVIADAYTRKPLILNDLFKDDMTDLKQG